MLSKRHDEHLLKAEPAPFKGIVVLELMPGCVCLSASPVFVLDQQGQSG